MKCGSIRRSVLLGAALLGAASWVTTTASAQEAREKFAGSTTVTVVEVPVTVSKAGQAVRGLTAENFQVLENGRVQQVVGFEVVDLEKLGAQESTWSPDATPDTVPMAGRRHFLLLFDMTFTRRHSIAKSVTAARDLVDGLHGSDLVAVALFGTGSGANILVRFTPDRGQVIRALDVLDQLADGKLKPRDVNESDGPSDPLGLLAPNAVGLAAQVATAAGIEFSAAGQAMLDGATDFDNTRGAGLQAELLLGMEASQRKEILARKRNDLEFMAESLSNLARMTRGLEGRKYMVQFSEGFDLSVIYGEFREGLTIGAGRANATINISGAGVKMLEDLIEEMRRSGWIIQAVDPSGAVSVSNIFDDTGLTNNGVTERFEASDGLSMIAAGTGGEVFENFNNLSLAMGSMLDKTSVTYILAVQTEEIALDGAYHPIRVKLVGAPRGARVSHRPGYFAPRPFGEEGDEERGLRVAQLVVAGDDGGDIDLGALATPFKTKEGKSGLGVWLEASGDALLAGGKDEGVAADVYVYALDTEGNIHDFFARSLSIDEVTAEATLTQGNLKFYGDLVLDPGRYQLRALIRDPDSDRYGLRTVGVEVSPFSNSEVRLLDPVIFDDPTRMYLAFREKSSAEDGVDEPYPFALGAGEFFPAIQPILSLDREVRFCLMAYHLFLEGLQVRAQVRRADGTRVDGAKLGVVGRSETTFEGLDRLFFELEPEGLEPGDYTFQVAIGDGNSPSYTSSTSFSLVN